MDARIWDPRTYTIPTGDGQRFGPLDKDGLGIMRTSVDPENFTTGLRTENGRMKHVVNIADGKVSPYRAEVTDWNWMLNLPIGTHEFIQYEQMITTPINMQSPISIYQGYAKSKEDPNSTGSVTQQLELSGKNQMAGAEPGQLQIINHAVNNDGKYVRVVTPWIPQQNVAYVVTMEIFHETQARGGYFKILIDDQIMYENEEDTVVAGIPICGQPKIGIYHHYLRTNWQEWGPKNYAAGHTQFHMETGPVSIIRFSPGEKKNSYYRALGNIIRPSETLKRYYKGQGNGGGGSTEPTYDEGFAAGVKQEVDALSGYANSR